MTMSVEARFTLQFEERNHVDIADNVAAQAEADTTNIVVMSSKSARKFKVVKRNATAGDTTQGKAKTKGGKGKLDILQLSLTHDNEDMAERLNVSKGAAHRRKWHTLQKVAKAEGRPYEEVANEREARRLANGAITQAEFEKAVGARGRIMPHAAELARKGNPRKAKGEDPGAADELEGNDEWNSLSFDERQAVVGLVMLKSSGEDLGAVDEVEGNQQWNSLSYDEREAVIGLVMIKSYGEN